MANYDYTIPQGAEGALSANKVLKNTYLLLAATLGFSAVTATLSVALAMPSWTYLVAVIVSMLLGIFVLPRYANSASGIGVIFGITGLLGFGLGAILTQYLALPQGPQIVGTAFGGTALIFLGLSGYALTSKRDFSFMGGFLFAGMVIALIAGLGAVFLQVPALGLAVAAMVALLSAGLILFETSRIVTGGETNYVLATVGLYVSIFNLFTSLLSLFGFGGSDE
jgi:modulator of FtsH protease